MKKIAIASLLVACSGGGGALTAEHDGAGGPSPSPGTTTEDERGGVSSGGEGSGACRGLVVCGDACTVLDEDAQHCGACGVACDAGAACRFGVCREEGCEGLLRKTCGTQCVNVSDNPAHCGDCNQACPARHVCFRGTCVDAFGSGRSCAEPIVMPGGGDNVNVAFTFEEATDTQALTCGDPVARPRLVFRFTADKTKEGTTFEIRGGLPVDDLVLEAFSSAACDASVALGCSDDPPGTTNEKRPSLRLSIESGKTYFLVVSSKGPPPAGRFYLRFDD